MNGIWYLDSYEFQGENMIVIKMRTESHVIISYFKYAHNHKQAVFIVFSHLLFTYIHFIKLDEIPKFRDLAEWIFQIPQDPEFAIHPLISP